MKITDISVHRVSISQNSNTRLLLQVHTDEGVTGISEAGRNLLVTRAYLEELIKPLLRGEDPCRPKRIWELLSLGDSD